MGRAPSRRRSRSRRGGYSTASHRPGVEVMAASERPPFREGASRSSATALLSRGESEIPDRIPRRRRLSRSTRIDGENRPIDRRAIEGRSIHASRRTYRVARYYASMRRYAYEPLYDAVRCGEIDSRLRSRSLEQSFPRER